MRRSGPVLVLGFDGVADRNAAEALRGTSLTLDASLLPVPDDPEEFYDHQLVGLTRRRSGRVGAGHRHRGLASACRTRCSR